MRNAALRSTTLRAATAVAGLCLAVGGALAVSSPAMAGDDVARCHGNNYGHGYGHGGHGYGGHGYGGGGYDYEDNDDAYVDVDVDIYQ